MIPSSDKKVVVQVTSKRIQTLVFLAIELVLYSLILTTGGDVLVWSSYLSIVICFCHPLLNLKNSDRWIVAGLACTVMADLFLVVWSPIQRTWGMAFFLIAQILYAIRLYRFGRSRVLLIVRLVAIGLGEAVAVWVLKEKTDLLALLSICYYVNLIANILQAAVGGKENRMFLMGLILFLLCDTVIGLQVAAGTYLPIGADSVLYKIIFMDFHLSWAFYLPSQVIISLCARYKR